MAGDGVRRLKPAPIGQLGMFSTFQERMMDNELPLTRAPIKAPRAGAIAGIIFSVLLIISLVLIWISVPTDPQDAEVLVAGGWKKVNLALHLVPFAGIAFLWFMGVLRDRMGSYEDRFFATVFLGSGLLFLAMLFTSAAVAGGLIMFYGAASGKLIESGVYTFGRTLTYQVMNIYTMKMAGVFMISTCTLAIRIGIFPRWMAFLGYAMACFLILSLGYFFWAPLIFPVWVLLISIYILMANLT
jgi:hypothetical protein